MSSTVLVMSELFDFQEGEISGELLTFHETISKMQEAEEEMVEYHKMVTEANAQWMNKDKLLLNMTNQVEYDQEGR